MNNPQSAIRNPQSDDDDVVLEVRHLTKRFPVGNALRPKQVHALNDVSFPVKRGEVMALVGESGAGNLLPPG